MIKNFLTIIALIAVFALVFAGCGSKDAEETTTAAANEAVAPESLNLSDWSMTTTTWSSPNGATVHLTAAPNMYAEGQTAAFVVRLEGEDIANIPCEWDGKNYTASAELNAANGLCYYVILTAADGTVTEVAVNTPAEPTDDALINMETSLSSYCNLMVEDAAFTDSKLTISSGTAQVQAPKITNEGETITCKEAVLVLNLNGEKVDSEKLTLNETDSVGGYELTLSGITFDLPAMENDQQLTLTLEVTLSNGQELSSVGGTFYYNEGDLMTAVG